MNDSTNSEPTSAAQSPFGSARGQKGSQARLAVLLVILVIAAGALGYDRLVALKGYKDAVAKLDAIIQGGEDPAISATDLQPPPAEGDTKQSEGDAKKSESEAEKSGGEEKAAKKGGGGGAAMRLEEPDEKELEEEAKASDSKSGKPRKNNKPLVYGIEDIRKVIGREPVLAGKAAEAPKLLPKRLVTSTDPKAWANRHGYWELYRWRRGLPFKSYDLLVIYSGPNEPLYSNYLGDKPLDPSNFSGVAIPIFDEENPPQGRAPVAAGAGMGGGEGKKGKRPGGGKKKAGSGEPAKKSDSKNGGQGASSAGKAASPEKSSEKKAEPENAKGDEGGDKNGEQPAKKG